MFPHPDDESFTVGGLLLQATKRGVDTNVLCLTTGEYGKSRSTFGAKLGKKRVNEFNNAIKILKVRESAIANFRDGFIKDSIDSVTEYISGYIDKYNPSVVVTYDPGGMTGHPDHIAVSKVLLKLCKKKNISLLYYSPQGVYRKIFKNLAINYGSKADYILRNTLNIKKTMAFFAHKSQVELNGFGMNIIIAFIISFSPETYHLVDFSKKYEFKYFPFKF